MEPKLDGVALRVLGSLLEKELTVPATYPLTMNGLLSACNQTFGREPVMAITEQAAEAAIDNMKTQRLVRLVHASHGARTIKYRQVADETFGLDPGERAALTVLILRGPQTTGELRARTDRLHRFSSLDEVEAALDRLSSRPEPLVRRLDRRPGHKEQRWIHLLGAEPIDLPAASRPSAAAEPQAAPDALLPELAPVTAFLGTWRGAGAGEYPTIEGFAYIEEIELHPVPGKAILAYRSSTNAADGGRALHGESGWLRVVGDAMVELVVAQGPGLVEICEGLVDGAAETPEMLLGSTLIGRSSTAKEVIATERRYRVDGDTLHYDLAMAAVGRPLTHHLRARLTRAPAGK
ncbi:MAG: DUF480 domain-containing protein [Acidimicrobiales bacterium]